MLGVYEHDRDGYHFPSRWQVINNSCMPHFRSSVEFVYVKQGELKESLNGVSSVGLYLRDSGQLIEAVGLTGNKKRDNPLFFFCLIHNCSHQVEETLLKCEVFSDLPTYQKACKIERKQGLILKNRSKQPSNRVSC